MSLGSHTNTPIEENMVRHMVLNSLRSYRAKHGAEFGELVIACDTSHYWRKQVFPYYKANRKKNQESSELDWKSIYECMNKIRAELKEFFPYTVIDVDTTEADDVIGTLVNEFGMDMNVGEKILIMSGDKDFIQLHTYANVKQYDPTRKKWVSHPNPKEYLAQHILKGDAGDGVPNVLSADNVFVVGERQKPMTSKRLEELLKMEPRQMPTMVERNYHRNEQLIDLKHTPKELKEKIMESFNSQKGTRTGHRKKLLDYFIVNKLTNLTNSIGEF